MHQYKRRVSLSHVVQSEHKGHSYFTIEISSIYISLPLQEFLIAVTSSLAKNKNSKSTNTTPLQKTHAHCSSQQLSPPNAPPKPDYNLLLKKHSIKPDKQHRT